MKTKINNSYELINIFKEIQIAHMKTANKPFITKQLLNITLKQN